MALLKRSEGGWQSTHSAVKEMAPAVGIAEAEGLCLRALSTIQRL